MAEFLESRVILLDFLGHIFGRFGFQLEVGLLFLVERGAANFSLLLELADDALILPANFVRETAN